MGYRIIAPMIKYGQICLVESGASKAIIDIGAEMTQGISVAALTRVRRINNIFMAENITLVRFLGAILTKIFMSQTICVIFLELRVRIW
jgi:hypothetical protein